MLRKKGLIINIVLAGAFIFLFGCFLMRVFGAYSPKVYSPAELVSPYRDEEFDASLLRLNTMKKLEDYCDSLYEENKETRTYPSIVSEVIRKKFFHGYSEYDFSTNGVSKAVAPLILSGLNAIVIPDDIVKYPNAACSQQSIVGMEIFKKKGYNVRKVTMWDTVSQSGHFAYEVFYDNGWHFFDTNQEPDRLVLRQYHRPSVAFLAAHPDIVAAAYRKRDHQLFQRLIQSYKTGPVNEFPANKAYIFQKGTRLLTYFGWAVIWLFVLVRSWRREGKSIRSLFRTKARKEKHTMPQHVVTASSGHGVRA